MIFDGFFGIDWSGDKSKFQKGIKVAYLDKENLNPKIITPSARSSSTEGDFMWLGTSPL